MLSTDSNPRASRRLIDNPIWRLSVALVLVVTLGLLIFFPDELGLRRVSTESSTDGARAVLTPRPDSVDPTPETLTAGNAVEESVPGPEAGSEPNALAVAVEPLRPTVSLETVLQETLLRSGLDELTLPAEDCSSSSPLPSRAGAPVLYSCAPGIVTTSAPGRVLMAVADAPSPDTLGAVPSETWSWQRLESLGRFVVVDHGRLGGSMSVVTVYSQLSDVADDITVGVAVEAGDPIGVIDASNADGTARLVWELWVDDDLLPADTPSVEPVTAIGWAAILADGAVLPASAACPLPSQVPELLPNAPRYYRNGVHRGVDFNCGRGNDAFAFRDGTVLLAVRDFVDPFVAQREASLANAAFAATTPHWILMMLYGNFIVIDHGTIEGVGRVTSISAHLDSVDDAIRVGSPVSAGQRLGEIGNAGTNAGSEQTDASVQLHWEVFIDDDFLGAELGTQETSAVYRAMLCQAPDASC